MANHRVDGLDLLDATVRDYATQARRIGGDPDIESVRRLAKADLELVDAAERDARPVPTKKPAERKAKADPVDGYAAEHGLTMSRASSRGRVDPLLDAKARAVGERWVAVLRRIHQIMAKRGDMRAAMARGDWEKAIREESTGGALAAEAHEAIFFYQLPFTKHRANPFYGMRQKDRMRALMRKLEDICDRSTGLMGPWWVR